MREVGIYNNIREGHKAERYTYPTNRFDSGDIDAWIASEAKFKHIFKMHGTSRHLFGRGPA